LEIIPNQSTIVATPNAEAASAKRQPAKRRRKRGARLTDLAEIQKDLAGKGFALGAPAFIRIFKAEAELELWLMRNGQYAKVDTYPICNFSGGLGPKLAEGDHQSPEGFYAITPRKIRKWSRNHRSLELDYPNAYDRAMGRTGSYIQIHGGCNSVGCFAMTDKVIERLYDVVAAAFNSGQARVPVHVFPFRMEAASFAAYEASAFRPFWQSLKPFHEKFEHESQLPDVQVCDRQYMFAGSAARDVSDIACERPWVCPFQKKYRLARKHRKRKARSRCAGRKSCAKRKRLASKSKAGKRRKSARKSKASKKRKAARKAKNGKRRKVARKSKRRKRLARLSKHGPSGLGANSKKRRKKHRKKHKKKR